MNTISAKIKKEWEKRQERESFKEFIVRHVREVCVNAIDVFEKIKTLPLSKLSIQFVISIFCTYLMTSSVFYHHLLLKIAGENLTLYRVILICLFTFPQAFTFYLLFKKDLSLFFTKVSKKQLELALMTACYTMAFAFVMNQLLNYGFSVKTNENAGFSALSINDIWLIFVQLLGENFFFFVSFFFGLGLLAKTRLKLFVSISVSALFAISIFGIAHLSAYNNNLAQCLVVIGIPSILQILLYFKTKNLWAAYLSHLIFDLIIFVVALSYIWLR